MEVTGLYVSIVDSLAAAVEGGESFGEIRDMFVDTGGFYRAVESWTDGKSGLNLLQKAVVCLRLEVVRYLCGLEKKGSVKFGYQYDAGGVSVNHALHLACKVGGINIVKLMVEEGDVESLETLRCPTVLRLPSIVTYPHAPHASHAPNAPHPQAAKHTPEPEPLLPFEVAVREGHLEVANYLCRLIISICAPGTYDDFPLHQACYLGNADYLRLLLDNGYETKLHKKDKNGDTALHVAACNSECACVAVLLASGVSVNCMNKCRSTLHLLYGCSVNAAQFARCTQLLVDHGANVNAVDHNNNSPLDYLVWEYGQRQLPRPSHKVDRYTYTRGAPRRADAQLTLDRFQDEVLKCMEILLIAGAHTTVHIYTIQKVIDHTIVHTLLQNTGWPLNSCILKTPMVVYRALALLFRHGADPNALAKNNNTSSFSMLLLHSLHEMQSTDTKCAFVHLFIMHGAALEAAIPPPQNFREYHADRLWSVYPVMLAVQERHAVPVLHVMLAYMSLPHVNAALGSARMRRWFSILLDGNGRDKVYKRLWKLLQKEQRQPRTLKHVCKLCCLQTLQMRGDRASELPIPTALKHYIQGMPC